MASPAAVCCSIVRALTLVFARPLVLFSFHVLLLPFCEPRQSQITLGLVNPNVYVQALRWPSFLLPVLLFACLFEGHKGS